MSKSLRLTLLAATLAAIALVAAVSPLEQTLGAGIRLVYFHGAWVWAGIVVYGLAALTGLAGLGWRRAAAQWSLALGRTGLIFWLTYLPLSLLVMQLFWGGLFLDEPRWRIPFTFGVVGVLLQIGLAVINHDLLTGAGNFLFGAALYWNLLRADSVLHPDSPVFNSGSLRIQVFFVLLLALSLLFAAQLVMWMRSARQTNSSTAL